MKTINRRCSLLTGVIILLCQAHPVLAASSARLWPSDALTKVLRQAAPAKEAGDVLKISGSRGETVSSQAVFRSSRDIVDVVASTTIFSHKSSGFFISANAVKLQWVRYIDVNRNSPGVQN